MLFSEWKRYFSTLSTERRRELYEAYSVLKSDPKIYEAYKYDIDNLVYLLEGQWEIGSKT